MTKAVLDASALLAVLQAERGADTVAAVLYGAIISAVNYSEVLKKVIERGGDAKAVQQMLDRQALRVVSFDREQAIVAASLLPQTSPFGLSFADRACLAIGQEFALPVFTAEERMSRTGLAIAVTLIRQRQ